MNKLNCSVSNCASNRNGRCCRSGINVGGCDATSASQTCCEAFQQEVFGVTNQTMGCCPNPELSIKCEAKDCVYNSNLACTASSVSIRGDGAEKKHDTCCDTFKKK